MTPPATPKASPGAGEGRVFAGTERYELRRRIGEGGMGVVYEVWDKKRLQRVALKTLHRTTAASVYRFKKEFRTLADVSHPNLVTLHELVNEGDRWFFTMELVSGQPLVNYVRPPDVRPDDAPTYALMDDDLTDEDPTLATPGAEILFHEERLVDAFRQLTEGLVALHDAGQLHRDIKPSNIMVTPEGRVVLLDFGLAVALNDDSLAKSQLGMMVGTVAYMAPEQAQGKHSKASDWYSVGVMLYEALTGKLPFTGTMYRVVLDKQDRRPEPIDDPRVPRSLSELCMRLLATNPKDRPLGREVLRDLGGSNARRATPALAFSAPKLVPEFVGRRQHLAALARAFEDSLDRPATVHIYGSSGIGKTALVRHFLEGIAEREEATVFAGRCYEHETVPYKAFDTVMDSVARRLRRLGPTELEPLLVPHIETLARVFPVLNRVAAIHRRSAKKRGALDPRELQRQAFDAGRELFRRLGAQRPTIIFVDDLQWSDTDSARFLAALLAPPNPPPLLIMASYRIEDRDSNAMLRELRTERRGQGLHEVLVGPLQHAESRALAKAVLRKPPEADETVGGVAAALRRTVPALAPAELKRRAEVIAGEANGSPLFIFELASQARVDVDAPAPMGEPTLTVDEILRLRFGRLSPDALTLLEVIAVAGRPLPTVVAYSAGKLDPHDGRPAAVLCGHHLARSRQGQAGVELETYHDRVRKAVVEVIPEGRRRARHAAIARALGPAAIHHAQESGEPELARAAAEALADQSAASLAFETSADARRIVLDLSTEADSRFALHKRHAEALELAGRADAAQAYLEAAEEADIPVVAREMRRRAAEQYLRFGHLSRGIQLMQDSLLEFGESLPKSTHEALAQLRVARSKVLARGLDFEARRVSAEDSDKIALVDTYWAASVGLTMVNNTVAGLFATRYLHLALDLGDPNRVARALAMELAFLTSGGQTHPTRVQRVLRTLRSLAKSADVPYVRGFAALGAAMAALNEGEWAQCRHCAERAEVLFRRHCRGVEWELATVRTFAVWSAGYLGDFGALEARVQSLLADARTRDNQYARALLCMPAPSAIVFVAADRPEDAERRMEAAKIEADDVGYQLARYWQMCTRLTLLLYRGRGEEAWQALAEVWPSFERSTITRVQVLRGEAHFLRARAALAAAAQSDSPSPFLAAARQSTQRLLSEGPIWARGLGRLCDGCVHQARGLLPEAQDLFDAAASDLWRVGMKAHAIAAEIRSAQLSRSGRAELKRLKAALRELGIVDPDAWCTMLTPQ